MRAGHFLETSITRHMLRAIDRMRLLNAKRSVLRVVVMTAATGLISWTYPTQQMVVVDLTKPAPPSARSMGVPGAAYGGIVGGEHPVFFPPRYKLPLELTIRGLGPPAPGARAAIEPKSPDFTLELVVKNVGGQPFDMPVGRDQAKVQRPGSKGRRTLVYRIRPENAKEKLVDLPLLGAVYGSESIPDSLLRIEPQQSVSVLLPVDAVAIARFMAKEANAAKVRIVCHEWALADDKYFIEKISDEVESQNTESVPIPRRTTKNK